MRVNDQTAVPNPLTERFDLIDLIPTGSNFAADVRSGLTSTPKTLLPQYFYDPLGSALFEAICQLPEYAITRAEDAILASSSGAIVRAMGNPSRIVELGSGNALKTRHLIGALLHERATMEYLPVDVDRGMLERSGADLVASHPRLHVTAILGDFRCPASVIPPCNSSTGVLFLGSSIGNLEPVAAVSLLRELRSILTPGDSLLLGADLRKPRPVLEAAYDDPTGVTAAFNLNLLGRINRQLGGRFDLRSFQHRAVYLEEPGRVEMHLVSRTRQQILITDLGLEIRFEAGETIHTESSHKYDDATLEHFAMAAGFELCLQWRDESALFTDALFVAR